MLRQRRICRRLEMEIGPLKDGFKVKLPQPKNNVIPSLAFRGLALGPSASGKTNAVVTMITDPRFYGGLFERIFWCSPTAKVDPGLDTLRRYVKTIGQNQEDEPTFHETGKAAWIVQRRSWKR